MRKQWITMTQHEGEKLRAKLTVWIRGALSCPGAKLTAKTRGAHSCPPGAWSGAGVGGGTIMFQDLKDSKKWSSKNTKIPRRSKHIQTYSICFQAYSRFTRIYLCLKIIRNYSRFIEIPPSCFSVFIKTVEIEDCFGPTKLEILVFVAPSLSKICKLLDCQKVDICENRLKTKKQFFNV